MTDGLIRAREALQAARDEVAQERAALREHLERVDAALAVLGGAAAEPRLAPARGRRTADPIPRGAQTAAILGFLDGEAQAVHADAVLAALETGGVAPRAKDPRASLGMQLRRLARLGRVRNVGRNRWERIKE